MTFNIEEITSKLWDLRSYSRTLSKRLEHETELPEEKPIPYLVDRLEKAFILFESAESDGITGARYELNEWLIRSSRFYLCRVMMGNLPPWTFEFPSAQDYYFK